MTLYVLATPIGNLEDLSPRAQRILAEVDAIVAEDTRHTRGLLSHFGIARPLLSLPAFDEKGRVAPIVERMVGGEHLALVTDAGTPAVSDPGEALVDAAREAGVSVVPIPGPSAMVAALSASGLASSRFTFYGFLQRKGPDRRELIEEIRRSRATAIVYEAGNRVGETLQELAEALGPRRAMVARELTKLHEETVRASLPELAARFVEGARGEVVLVIEGGALTAPEVALPPIEEAIATRLAAGDRVKEVAQALAEAYGLSRQEVYAKALTVKDAGRG